MAKTLLVADDDQEWRDLLRLWLIKGGYEVRIVECGAAVMPALEESLPDGIVLDFDLGDMRGSDVSASIKAKKEWAHIPIVIFTSMAGEITASAEGKADHFIVKTKDFDELLFVLGDVLER